ncbi:MAG: hypothetical protein V3U96_10405 [Paracoccaceae bacterium]
MKSTLALTVAAFTLAGCVDSSNLTSQPTVVTQNIGTLPSGFVATYDSTSSEVVLTVDGVEVGRLAGFSGGAPGFNQYIGGSNAIAEYAATISGAGTVTIAHSTTPASGLSGVQVTRLGDTVLPSGASATFNGEYTALFIDDATLIIMDEISGDAQLTANFVNGTIFGSITNRSAKNNSTTDVTLEETAITAVGGFSGTVTGGGIPFLSATSDGTYAGLIVGATGTEAVGGMTLSHYFGPSNIYTEIGGFIAAE